MRILMVGDYPPDPRLGSAKVMYKLQEHIGGAGHECVLAFSSDIGLSPSGRRLRELATPVMTHRLIERMTKVHGRFDVVDIASGEGMLYGLLHTRSGSSTAFVSRSHGIEHLNHARALVDAREGISKKSIAGRIWHPLTRLNEVALAARGADQMIVLNEDDRQFVINRGWKSDGEVTVIPHGVDDKYLAPVPEQARGKGFLYCGTWTETKGVHYLVRAFTQLVDEGLKMPLTILGGGWPESYIQSQFPQRVLPFLKILPRADESQVIEAYRTHDALAFPSTYEGFGLVLLEAMTQSLAVIATPVGAALSLVQDGINGLSVPARNSNALAGAMRKIATDEGLRKRLGKKGRETASAYSWRRAAAATVDAYEEAVDRRAGHLTS